jgi:hypothetical protein
MAHDGLEDEKTPVDGEGQWLPVMRRFDKLDGAVGTIGDGQLELRQMFAAMSRDFRHLDQRVTAIELSSRWLPLVFSSLAVALSIWSAARGH